MTPPLDPYAPPRAAAGQSIPPGDALVVSRGEAPDEICVKCGARDAIHRRQELLRYTPSWAWGTLLLGVLGILIVMCVERVERVVLSICPACDLQWRRVTRRRRAVVWSLLPMSAIVAVVFVAAARGTLTDGAVRGLLLALVALWIALFVVVHAPGTRDALVTAAFMDRSRIRLRGLHPDARRGIVATRAIE